MTIIKIDVSAYVLTDVNKRMFYIGVTLFGKCAWFQYWPRPIIGQAVNTWGIRQ